LKAKPAAIYGGGGGKYSYLDSGEAVLVYDLGMLRRDWPAQGRE